MSDSNRAGDISITMVVEVALPTDLEKGRAVKRKTKDADRLKEVSTGDHKFVSSCPRMDLRLVL